MEEGSKGDPTDATPSPPAVADESQEGMKVRRESAVLNAVLTGGFLAIGFGILDLFRVGFERSGIALIGLGALAAGIASFLLIRGGAFDSKGRS